MAKQQKILIIVSLVIAICLIGGAVYLKFGRTTNDVAKFVAEQSFTATQLAQFNGKKNSPCYVAVQGKVYSIKQGNLWQDGEHTTSNQQAYCGRDLTSVIGQSPHGTSKLGALTVVGTLTN